MRVMTMPAVQTHREDTTVPAILDTQEMGQPALVHMYVCT